MNILKKAACAFAVFCMAQAAFSVPADPQPKKVKQADGSFITICVRGDESGHVVLTADGYPLCFNEQTANYEYAVVREGVLSLSGIIAADASVRSVEAASFLSSHSINAHTSPHALKSLKPLNGTGAPKGLTYSGGSKPSKKRLLINEFPLFGSPRSLVLLIEFSDVSFTSVGNPKDFYTRMLNEEGFTHTNGADGSALDFFKASSMGQFTPQFDVVGPIKLSKPRSYYGGDSPRQDCNVAEVIIEACQLADGEIDFSQYDTNGDGVVDNVYYFYAGSGQADNTVLKEAIWPHSSNLATPINVDGVKVIHYACSNELRCDDNGNLSTAGIGTFVHEFSHVLGLIDHYDTYYSGLAFHPGPWDPMATGSYNNNGNTPPLFTAFERSELGWLALTELKAGTDSVSRLPELTESNFAYRISVPGKPSEYYVLENRQQQGWDRFLPGHGMLMWHIDVDTAEWLGNSANALAAHQLVDIVEADKIYSENTRSGDPFPGTNNVTTWTVKAWDETELLSFDEIAEEDGMIKFVQKGTSYEVPQPAGFAVSDIADSTFSVSWQTVPDATYYILSISSLASDGTKTPIEGYDNKRLSAPDTLLIGGLQPLTAYEVTLQAGIGTYLSQPLTSSVTTTAIPFTKLAVANVQVSGISGSQFTVSWDAVRDAESYLLTVNKLSYSAATTDMGYAFDTTGGGMPSLWSSSTSTLNSIKGNFGVAAPSLRMNADGDYIEMAYPESKIQRLQFWLRSSKEAGAVVIEKYSADEWSEVQRFTPSTVASAITAEIGGADKVRISYERESGYICIDDIVLSCSVIERSPAAGYSSKNIGNVLSHTVSGLEHGAAYGIILTAISGSEQSLPSSESVVTIGDASGIEEIVPADEAETFIYDLHGRRLPAGSTPKGLVIIKKGNKVEKVVFD